QRHGRSQRIKVLITKSQDFTQIRLDIVLFIVTSDMTRKIRPYLTQYATQLLVQTLVSSRLDYCNDLLTGLPACVVKPLQMIQNAAARLVFNQTEEGTRHPATHRAPLAACSCS